MESRLNQDGLTMTNASVKAAGAEIKGICLFRNGSSCTLRVLSIPWTRNAPPRADAAGSAVGWHIARHLRFRYEPWTEGKTDTVVRADLSILPAAGAIPWTVRWT